MFGILLMKINFISGILSEKHNAKKSKRHITLGNRIKTTGKKIFYTLAKHT